MPIFIDDTPAINIFELRAKCRRLKQNHNIGLVVIDYLQLMSAGDSSKKGNREQEISSISRALKGMAKELDLPVIAAEIIISKHRNGSLGTVTLKFIKENVKFVDFVDHDFRNTGGMGSDIFSDGGASFITRPSALNDDVFEDG
jgi:replicative DNA helicase